MYVNRFFLTAVGTAFALWHITETDNKYGDETMYQEALKDGRDRSSLWVWGAALYWTYAKAVDAAEDYARGTLMLSDTRTELIDLRYGVPMCVDIYASIRLKDAS